MPEGFEITEVDLAAVGPLGRARKRRAGKLLGVKLREQTTETGGAQDRGHPHAGQARKSGSTPRLEPLDVVGSVTVFGLLVEDRLKAESLAGRRADPHRHGRSRQVLPASLLDASPASRRCAPVAAWYAPQSDFALTAHYKKPPAEMAVTTSLLLVLADKGQELLGGLAFLPQVEKRFSFDVSFPPAGRSPASRPPMASRLPFERYADGPPLPLPKGEGTTNASESASPSRGGMAVGQEFKANFRAVRTPPGWLAEWKSTPVEFPNSPFSAPPATMAPWPSMCATI